jgi:hypothetical protein
MEQSGQDQGGLDPHDGRRAANAIEDRLHVLRARGKQVHQQVRVAGHRVCRDDLVGAEKSIRGL